MAKTVRSSQDYTIKAGAGSSGSHTIRLDASQVRIPGNLTVEGTQTTINSTTLTLEDQFMEVNRNNSTAGTEDSGIFFNQGSNNNQILYYDADQSEFVMGATTHASTVSAITNITPGKLKLADPTESDHAATKAYVDSAATGATLTGSTNNQVTTVTGANAIQGEANLTFDGTTLAVTGNITATTTIANDAVQITDNHIKATRTNDALILEASGTGDVVINDTLTFSAAASTPTASAVTKIYNKTAGGGGTGLFFINSNISSGTEGELISKKKATALAIALG